MGFAELNELRDKEAYVEMEERRERERKIIARAFAVARECWVAADHYPDNKYLDKAVRKSQSFAMKRYNKYVKRYGEPPILNVDLEWEDE